jgi:hypothetical protein
MKYNMLQHLINVLYRHPKAKQKKINEFGGHAAYKQMFHNSGMMQNAMWKLPAVQSYADGLPLYFLTGEKYLYQTLFCIQSLSKSCSEKFRFFLVDDGSFTTDIIKQINTCLPGANVITQSIIEQNIRDKLPEDIYPGLINKRKTYPHIKKLIDIHVLPFKGYKIVLDSDMLFWNKPKDVIKWLKNPEKPIHMVDCEQSYGYSIPLMEKLAGNKIPDKVNVGIIGLNSDVINWGQVETWVNELEATEGKTYYLEQALSAMLVAGKDCLVLKKTDYIVNPSEAEISASKGCLHHYVAASKKGYFDVAWRKVIR